jgi:hypothetical protein
VASERQMVANRRNSRRSTGPRSIAGKKRAAQNAYQHGLSLSVGSLATFAKPLDRLARKIAGDTTDKIKPESARAVAQAELELARVRRAKVALINTLGSLNAFDPRDVTLPQPTSCAARMPSPEPHRAAEAPQCTLLELLKLDRYARRAFAA